MTTDQMSDTPRTDAKWRMNNGRAACYTRLGSNEHGAAGWRTRGLQTSTTNCPYCGSQQCSGWRSFYEYWASLSGEGYRLLQDRGFDPRSKERK